MQAAHSRLDFFRNCRMWEIWDSSPGGQKKGGTPLHWRICRWQSSTEANVTHEYGLVGGQRGRSKPSIQKLRISPGNHGKYSIQSAGTMPWSWGLHTKLPMCSLCADCNHQIWRRSTALSALHLVLVWDRPKLICLVHLAPKQSADRGMLQALPHVWMPRLYSPAWSLKIH